MPPVEPCRVGARKPLPARDQILLGRLHHQVERILHQAERVNRPSRLGARWAKGFEETVPTTVIPENGFAPVSAIQHVVKRACKFNPELARQGGTLPPTTRLCQ